MIHMSRILVPYLLSQHCRKRFSFIPIFSIYLPWKYVCMFLVVVTLSSACSACLQHGIFSCSWWEREKKETGGREHAHQSKMSKWVIQSLLKKGWVMVWWNLQVMKNLRPHLLIPHTDNTHFHISPSDLIEVTLGKPSLAN